MVPVFLLLFLRQTGKHDLAESWRVDPGQPAFVTQQNLAELTANVAHAKR